MRDGELVFERFVWHVMCCFFLNDQTMQNSNKSLTIVMTQIYTNTNRHFWRYPCMPARRWEVVAPCIVGAVVLDDESRDANRGGNS